MPIPANRRNAVIPGSRARLIVAIEQSTGHNQTNWGQTPQPRKDAWEARCDAIHDNTHPASEIAEAITAVNDELNQ